MIERPSVWAPRASSVELVLAERRLPMRRSDGGWWAADQPLPPGTDYGFSLDGGEALPDPRSPWQPGGIHGLSRTVDHDAFTWTDAAWSAPPLADAILYEVHIGTFTPAGTFDAAIERLDDLVSLGVTHLELMPVAEFSGDRGWGYDGVDLFAPHHAYGGPDGLKRLIDAAHAAGVAVLLDVVYNHLGPEGNHLARFGPYFGDRHATPWGPAVNLDGRGSHEVRRFVIDNALAWLRDYHLDGLRIDAVHAIFDSSAIHVLEELAAAVHEQGASLGRRLVVIAESDLNDPRLVRPVELGGYGLDAAWADDVHHAVHVALTGETGGYYADFADPGMLARALTDPYLYDGRRSVAHDRRHGRPAGELPGHRFVASVQNHDQVGNRALGERLSHLVGPGRARIAAALLLTAPYVPLLFAGEEWAATAPFRYFTGHAADELGHAVSAGRRAEFAAFGWDPEAVPDPQDPATFTISKLDHSEKAVEPHASMLAWYRSLLELRRSTPELRDGDRTAIHATGGPGGLLRVDRGPVSVVANLGDTSVPVDVQGTVRLGWPPDATTGDALVLHPDGVAVVERR